MLTLLFWTFGGFNARSGREIYLAAQYVSMMPRMNSWFLNENTVLDVRMTK